MPGTSWQVIIPGGRTRDWPLEVGGGAGPGEAAGAVEYANAAAAEAACTCSLGGWGYAGVPICGQPVMHDIQSRDREEMGRVCDRGWRWPCSAA